MATHSANTREIHRFWRLVLLLSFGVAIGISAQRPDHSKAADSADPLASLKTGNLTVWESGRSSFLGWDAIQSALAADFPALHVTFLLVPPQNSLNALATAKQQGSLPDVVFVDNWSQGGPLIAQFQAIELMGQTRFSPSRGWWFQMKDGANQPAAFAFLQWLQSPPHWQAPRFETAGMTGVDEESVRTASLDVVSSLAGGTGDEPQLDPDAVRFKTSEWGTYCGRIAEIATPTVRFMGGNGRIAYAAIASEAKTSGGKVVCSGSINSFLVLRKRGNAWKVLLLIPSISLPQAVSMGSNFDQLGMLAAQGSQPAPPLLLFPSDGEPQTRFPKQDIAWQQNLPHPAAYVLESRFGVPKNGDVDYGPSIIHFVDPAQYGDVVRMPMPFGVGMQPHRWRVWAVGKDGEVAVSEWRTVDFTN